jgi:hypothetical protein
MENTRPTIMRQPLRRSDLAISGVRCSVERMVEMVATFIESLSEEETLELTRELDRRREKIDLLQERAVARLAELRAAGVPA